MLLNIATYVNIKIQPISISGNQESLQFKKLFKFRSKAFVIAIFYKNCRILADLPAGRPAMSNAPPKNPSPESSARKSPRAVPGGIGK